MRRAWRCARSTASTRPRTAWCCTTRTCASAAATASTPARSARRSSRRPAPSACAARWTSAPSAPAAPSPTAARPSSRSTAAIACPRASSRRAPRCARPRRCSAATATSSPTSTVSACCAGARAPRSGAGAPRTVPASRAPFRRNSSSSRNRAGRSREVAFASGSGLRAGPALAQQGPGPLPEDPVKAQQQRQVTQPGNNSDVWREVRSGQPQFTTTTVKGRETEILVQSWGETWRRIRNGPMTFYGGWLMVLVILIIGGLYAWKGPVKLDEPRSGRLLVRFSALEMTVHWTAAISFCVLALSGLTMLFGKHVLLPVIGYTLFAWLTALGKNLHNFIAPIFIVSVLAMIFMWLRDNLPKSYDWMWFGKAWAFFARGEHIRSGRFNAGEKAWFWGGVILLSVIVSWSGIILLFPNFDQTRAVMQDAWIWHASAALLYIAISFGHIYMGTIGVEGAYGNMRTGYTDETWAKEHHGLWYNEVKSGSRASAGGAVPAGAPHMKEKT